MKSIISKSEVWSDQGNVVQFPDPIENLHRTLNLLKLPDEVASCTESLLELHSKVDAIQRFILKFSDSNQDDRYLSPKEASAYLGMSETTFDKYRYETKVRIKGYKLDGKNWYKRSDLDRFMLTYESKAAGLA